MRSPLPNRRSLARLGLLDALRLAAAFFVVAFHYTARVNPGWGGSPPSELAGLGRWASYGRLGVPLFFVISGFVLLMSAWGKTIPNFVASRVGRLFPAYWVAVLFSGALIVFLWPEGAAFFHHTITKSGAALNMTMMQGAFGVPDLDGPYWTLWYEARFYLLIAVFMMVGINRRRVLGMAALWPVVGALASASDQRLLTTLLIPDYAQFFAGGMLLYLIYRDGHDVGTWLLIAFQAAIAVNFMSGVYPQVLTVETPWAPSKTMIVLVTIACFALVALVTVTPLNRLHAKWMAFAGALTYPVYLVHENLGWYLFHRLHGSMDPWVLVGMATAATVVAATVIHYAVERPFGPRLRRATLLMIETTLQRSDQVAEPSRSVTVSAGHDQERPTARHHVATSRPPTPPVPRRTHAPVGPGHRESSPKAPPRPSDAPVSRERALLHEHHPSPVAPHLG